MCIRPLTYESAEEASWLRKVFAPRGFLENTVFAIMDWKASKYLAQPGRIPYMAFPGCENDPTIMAKGLTAMLKGYESYTQPGGLPLAADVRDALNVAACDHQPLCVISGTEAERAALKSELAKLAWAESTRGRMVFAEAKQGDEQKAISGDKGAGALFVQPDEYGVKGTVLSSAANPAMVGEAMQKALASYKVPGDGDHRAHIRRGVQQGIRWKPKTKVEDQQAQQATDRTWAGRGG